VSAAEDVAALAHLAGSAHRGNPVEAALRVFGALAARLDWLRVCR